MIHVLEFSPLQQLFAWSHDFKWVVGRQVESGWRGLGLATLWGDSLMSPINWGRDRFYASTVAKITVADDCDTQGVQKNATLNIRDIRFYFRSQKIVGPGNMRWLLIPRIRSSSHIPSGLRSFVTEIMRIFSVAFILIHPVLEVGLFLSSNHTLESSAYWIGSAKKNDTYKWPF